MATKNILFVFSALISFSCCCLMPGDRFKPLEVYHDYAKERKEFYGMICKSYDTAFCFEYTCGICEIKEGPKNFLSRNPLYVAWHSGKHYYIRKFDCRNQFYPSVCLERDSLFRYYFSNADSMEDGRIKYPVKGPGQNIFVAPTGSPVIKLSMKMPGHNFTDTVITHFIGKTDASMPSVVRSTIESNKRTKEYEWIQIALRTFARFERKKHLVLE